MDYTPVGFQLIIDRFPSGNPSPELRVPDHFRVNYRGVFVAQGSAWRQITRGPLALSGQARDPRTGEEFLSLAWFTAEGWRSAWLPRLVVMSERRLRRLQRYGLPIESPGAVSGFLRQLEGLNRDRLPVVPIADLQREGVL
ncbi:MAG: hypothetical protein ACO1SX_23700 [Actinomycetota bacterium]